MSKKRGRPKEKKRVKQTLRIYPETVVKIKKHVGSNHKTMGAVVDWKFRRD